MIVDHQEVKLLQEEQEVISLRSRQEDNSRVVSEWLKGLGDFNYDALIDIQLCLNHFAYLSSNNKANQSQWILRSRKFTDLLQNDSSSILEVNLATPSASLNISLSLTSALVTQALRSTARFPVLAFFCRHRNNESTSEDRSGPIALVTSLNTQLLRFIAEYRCSVNLSTLEGQTFFSRAKRSVKSGLLLLETLLSLLPTDDVVFVVIDRLAYLSGSGQDGRRVIKKLREITQERKDIVLKIILTQRIGSGITGDSEAIDLYVQDVVSGRGSIDIDRISAEIVSKVMPQLDAEDGDREVGLDKDEGNKYDEESSDGEDSEGC